MTSLNKLLFVTVALLAGCTSAKSPLKDPDAATFTIIPEKIDAVAELGQATPDSFGRARTQRLHFTVCLQSKVTGTEIALGTKFAIVDPTGAVIPREIDGGGCLHWDETHDVSPMAPERNVRLERRIRAVQNHRGEVRLAFNVKPWLDGRAAVQSASNLEQFTDAIAAGAGLSFRDQYPVATLPAREKSAAAVVGAEPPAEDRPHFLLGENHLELNYVSGGRSPEFEIDQFLNLSTPYRFTFALRPLIARRVFSGTRQAEPMTSGRLRLTLVFLASARGDLREDNRYLTSAQVEGEVEPNGVFAGTIVVRYPHALFASGRQTVLVRLSAPGQASVAAGGFSGSLSFIDRQGAMLMLADDRDAEAIHAEQSAARAALTRARGSPLSEFLNANDVTRFTPDQAPLGGLISAEELNVAMDHDLLDASSLPTDRAPAPVRDRLCRAFFNAGSPPTPESLWTRMASSADVVAGAPSLREMNIDRYCDKHAAFVTIQQLDFVEELATPTPRNVKIVTYSNQDFGLYYSRDEAKVSAQNLAFGLHAQAPELLGFFGDLSYVQSRIQTRSRRSTFAQSQSMTIDVGTLEVKARVRSCLFIKGSAPVFPAKPWLICKPEVRPAAWIEEHFFYYSQIFGSNHSPFIDPFDGQSGVKLFVRGRFDMLHRSTKLQAPDFAKTGFNVFIQDRQPNLSEFNTTGRVDGLTRQAVPGAWLRN